MTPEPDLTRPTSKADLDAIAARWHAEQKGKKHQLLVCARAGCVSSGCHAVTPALLVNDRVVRQVNPDKLNRVLALCE